MTFRASGRLFALTFSYGRVYLDDAKLETDFGLRVAVNCLDDQKLKGVERSNLGDAIREVAQSPFQREFHTFGVDEALDLIRRISGSVSDESDFADNVSGAKALRISREMELQDIPALASEALAFYASTRYKATAFCIIDTISPVLDVPTCNDLNEALIESIKSDTAQFELGLPLTFQDDAVTFKFVGASIKGSYLDLVMTHYREGLGQNLAELSVQDLKDHKIAAVFDEVTIPPKKWSIFESLVGSLECGGGRYAINEGQWYQVDEAFKQAVDKDFRELVADWSIPPRPLRKIYPPGKRSGGRFETEYEYNRAVADDLGYILLDSDLLEVAGIPRSNFEVCDLLDVSGRRFIHVKKSSRRSSVLSHFFKQGRNSASLMRQFPSCWPALISAIRKNNGSEQADKLETARTGKWTIEFHIADTPRNDGSFSIPFFRRVSLRDDR